MKYEATKKNSQAEKGTGKDVKGVPHKDGRSEHMRYSNHEFGEYKEGTHFHDHHKGK